VLKKKGIDFQDRFFISKNAHLVTPYNRLLDVAMEFSRGKGKIGTTGRGIGPTYSDKAMRTGIRIADLLDHELLKDKLKNNLDIKLNLIKKVYNISNEEIKKILKENLVEGKDGKNMERYFDAKEGLSFDIILKEFLELGEYFRPFLADTSLIINNALNNGRSVLAEGAQGLLLDVDFGTYPYVTSSNPSSGSICTGLGVGPTKVNEILGVMKAYTTRVGCGPFPTEDKSETGKKMQELGGEFGATTGRPRRCGWFDSLIAKYAVRVNGLTGVLISKLDVLDRFETIKVCIGYDHKGREITEFSTEEKILEDCIPSYKEFKGWNKDITQVRKYDDLPDEAKTYLEEIEKIIGVPIVMISVGPSRDQIIRI